MVFSAMSAGAVGYLLKGADGADIVTAVRAAGAGQAVFGAALAQRMRSWFAAPVASKSAAFEQLTDRERSILDGVAAGLTNIQIGHTSSYRPRRWLTTSPTFWPSCSSPNAGKRSSLHEKPASAGTRDS